MAGQNRSSAVMQQRVEPHDSLDDYPTQSWATRALLEYVIKPRFDLVELQRSTVWEPTANRGYMARPLEELFVNVYASDIHDYGYERLNAVVDFLFPFSQRDAGDIDWIITNPPFRLAEEFIHKSLAIANVGCAFIVRSAFLESVGRYERLFKETPPSIIAQFSERVPMLKGRIDPHGTTATAYSWLTWIKEKDEGIKRPTEFQWIPPCRKQFERQSDYEIETEGEI